MRVAVHTFEFVLRHASVLSDSYKHTSWVPWKPAAIKMHFCLFGAPGNATVCTSQLMVKCRFSTGTVINSGMHSTLMEAWNVFYTCVHGARDLANKQKRCK